MNVTDVWTNERTNGKAKTIYPSEDEKNHNLMSCFKYSSCFKFYAYSEILRFYVDEQVKLMIRDSMRCYAMT